MGTPRIVGKEIGSQNPVMRPAEVVSGRERFLDYLQLMVNPGLEFENHAAIGDGFRFEDYVPLTAAVDVGDRIARLQLFDGHQFGISE